jgi:hypothetical protein
MYVLPSFLTTCFGLNRPSSDCISYAKTALRSTTYNVLYAGLKITALHIGHECNISDVKLNSKEAHIPELVIKVKKVTFFSVLN